MKIGNQKMETASLKMETGSWNMVSRCYYPVGEPPVCGVSCAAMPDTWRDLGGAIYPLRVRRRPKRVRRYSSLDFLHSPFLHSPCMLLSELFRSSPFHVQIILEIFQSLPLLELFILEIIFFLNFFYLCAYEGHLTHPSLKSTWQIVCFLWEVCMCLVDFGMSYW